MVQAIWNGAIIAESDDTVIVDGNHYFPRHAVNGSLLMNSNTKTVCPWKGIASYYTLMVYGEANTDAAWCYPDAYDAAKNIEGRIAFWRGVEIKDQ